MRLSVLGGSGAWPTATDACSGFLLELDGFRLAVDLGYATLPQLLRLIPAEAVDAVVISHGHPDHCADLNPLLRARALGGAAPTALAVYAPPRALEAVLSLDRPGMLSDAYELRVFEPGQGFAVGPFDVTTRLLPHHVPNAGLRIAADGGAVAYTGDCGPCRDVVELARDAAVLIAEATYPNVVPAEEAGRLSSANDAGREACEARVARLVLTHLWPGTDPARARRAAAKNFSGPIDIAGNGLVIDGIG